jgi:uncharacterized protein with PIN domain
MLYAPNKQIAHCYFRAAECRELAELSVSPTDRQHYTEREQAWLTLARSHEFQARLAEFLKELERQTRQDIWTAVKPPQCPNCSVEMKCHTSHPTKHVFLSTSFACAIFLCPNCSRISDQLIAMPGN